MKTWLGWLAPATALRGGQSADYAMVRFVCRRGKTAPLHALRACLATTTFTFTLFAITTIATLKDGWTPSAHDHALMSLSPTMIQGSAEGAWIALARGMGYRSHTGPTNPLGLNPVNDQKLGGLTMWIVCAAAYWFGALTISSHRLVRVPRATRFGRWPPVRLYSLNSGKRTP